MTDILYGAPLSLYSGKARAYMDWKGIDYREDLATPDIHQNVIIPNVGRPVIPVVKTADGAVLQDTTLIIDHYEESAGGPSVYPETPAQRLAALLLEVFGDEWLVIPAMHYRWNYNEEWVYGEFGKVALPDGSPEEQLAAGRKRGANFKGFCAPLGINEETIPAIEKSYEALLADLNAHFAEHPFLFGDRPSIGDYGLIGPLYAHNYRDPKSGEIMERLAPTVVEWVRRVVNVKEPLSGQFLPNDEVPETLLPVLKRMLVEQLPYLQNVAQQFGEWAATQEFGAEIPRVIGMAGFTIEGAQSQRMSAPFSLWMLQRALDYHAGLSGQEKDAASKLLDSIGGAVFEQFEMPAHTEFRDHKLWLVS